MKKSCQKQCKLNENKVCTGCGRTIEEIKLAYKKPISSVPPQPVG